MSDVSTWTATRIDKQQQYRDEEGIPRPPNGIEDFGQRYGVYTPFLPFASRDYDPLERLSYVREYVESLRETKPAFTSSEMADEYNLATQTIAGLDPLFYYAVGSRPLNRQAHKGRQRYANPAYKHLDTLEPVTVDDPGRTLELARNFANVGYHDIHEIADYFGRPRTKLGQHILSLSGGKSYAELRENGRTAMGRTWYIIREWDKDMTHERIADVFGVKNFTVNNWIRRYAREADFQVPDDPTGGYRYVERHGDFRDGSLETDNIADALRARERRAGRTDTR